MQRRLVLELVHKLVLVLVHKLVLMHRLVLVLGRKLQMTKKIHSNLKFMLVYIIK